MTDDGKNPSDGSACGCGGGSCCGGAGKWIWVVLAVAVVGVFVAKSAGKKESAPAAPAPGDPPAAVQVTNTNTPMPDAVAQGKALPRLVDLGAGKCIPCKMMAPVLEDLKKTYAGKMDVQFIDVLVNPEAGKPYAIRVIPTQIFYDAAGKELFRHEGFFGKEDILTKWKEFGVELAIGRKGEEMGNDGKVE